MAVGGSDQLRHLRGEETLELADALDLGELFLDALLQRLVPVLQLLGLRLELARLLLHRRMRDRELAAFMIHLGEQPRIAHRQHGLVREGPHQADQVGENSPLARRSTTSEPNTPCWSTSGTTSTA